jgi:hypothetical protein
MNFPTALMFICADWTKMGALQGNTIISMGRTVIFIWVSWMRSRWIQLVSSLQQWRKTIHIAARLGYIASLLSG